MAKAPKPSHSAATLDRILDKGGPVAELIRANFGRPVLSRLRRGVRLPKLRTAVKMREVTRGRITEKGWLVPVGS